MHVCMNVYQCVNVYPRVYVCEFASICINVCICIYVNMHCVGACLMHVSVHVYAYANVYL